MAHFRGTVEGNRSEASRLGSANSGLQTTANGWEIGCSVGANVIGGEDVITIIMTSGSGFAHPDKHIGHIKLGAEGIPTFFPALLAC